MRNKINVLFAIQCIVGRVLFPESNRMYDEETEELSKDLVNITGQIADLTKTASNNYQGVSIFTDETRETYKSTYQIIVDIADIWNELTDKDQASLLEMIAGKRNSQVVASAISNIKTAKEAMQTMSESAGSADRETQKSMQSISHSINAFKETITEIAQSTITQDFLKSIVDDGTKMLETFVNAGNVIKPFFDVIAKGVSIIEQLTSGLGGLDKVLAGFAVNKMFGSGFRNLFGVDRDKMISLVLNMST